MQTKENVLKCKRCKILPQQYVKFYSTTNHEGTFIAQSKLKQSTNNCKKNNHKG